MSETLTPAAPPGIERGRRGNDRQGGADLVEVHCDYISADHPIRDKFPPSTSLGDVKQWARQQFVPNPPSDKTYDLSDDKTRRRFTEEEERHTLAQEGYTHQAKFRLNEEQRAGSRPQVPR